ncbi:hypothetical protein [Luteitalea sp.]
MAVDASISVLDPGRTFLPATVEAFLDVLSALVPPLAPDGGGPATRPVLPSARPRHP